MTKRWLLSLLTLLVLTHLAGIAHAQVEQGAITGRVFDEGGGVIPGATVIVTQTGTGVARETLTNAGWAIHGSVSPRRDLRSAASTRSQADGRSGSPA